MERTVLNTQWKRWRRREYSWPRLTSGWQVCSQGMPDFSAQVLLSEAQRPREVDPQPSTQGQVGA